MKIIKKIVGKLIAWDLRNKINISKTILANFAFLPYSQAIKLPILIYGPCKFGGLKGKIEFDEPIKRGLLTIGLSDPVRSQFSKSYISINGTLKVEGNLTLRRGINMSIANNSTFVVGNNVFISDNCTIISFEKITIGKGTVVGNNTVVMDSDFHSIINTNNGCVNPSKKSIVIGENNWLGGWCTVKKGTVTPKGTIIAGPYSMVSKDYTDKIPEYSLIAGSPAKLLVSGMRLVNNSESEKMLGNHFAQSASSFQLDDLSKLDKFCSPK
ncbi:MAG: acyltransferase [Rikenellaceae bacterium]